MHNANYQLLKVKEQISENLSSVQIANILDDLIMRCLKPLVKNTKYLEYSLLELLPYIFLNQRRKLSNRPTEDLRNDIFTFIMIDDFDEKIKILKRLRLERSVYLTVLSSVEEVSKKYLEEINSNLNHIQKIEEYDEEKLSSMYFHLYVKGDFYETAQSVIYWLNYVYKFRAMIVEKFIRLAYIESVKMASSTELNIDQTDLFRDLIVSIHKAIDKYDPEKGALSSYVNIWFMEAKTNIKNTHEYGVAYQMPTGQRKRMIEDGSVQSITLPLNDEIAESIEDQTQNILENIIEDENEFIMHNLACRADIHKIYCLTNNIRYTLTNEDLIKQKQSLKPRVGYNVRDS